MKKITTLIFMSFCAIGFSQSVDPNEEIKGPKTLSNEIGTTTVSHFGGEEDCDYEHVVIGDANGGSGSGMDSDFKTAADIVVPAGENFTLTSIEVPFLTYAPEDAPTEALIVYYENDAGLPGVQISSQTVIPTIISSRPFVDPSIGFQYETSLELTPFIFEGDETNDTTYWIAVSMRTATGQGTVFWLFTEGTGIEGEPMVRYNGTEDLWSVTDPEKEAIYLFSGDCSPLSVSDNTIGGFSFFPNPSSDVLNLKSIDNIENISIYNLLGQRVMVNKINATTSKLDISGLNIGTYIMKVTINGQIATYKVLKN